VIFCIDTHIEIYVKFQKGFNLLRNLLTRSGRIGSSAVLGLSPIFIISFRISTARTPSVLDKDFGVQAFASHRKVEILNL
jgi:hypothetical protein